MSGADKNYRFGNKAQWRRTIWNEIAGRVRPFDATVVYLPGAENLDRDVALRKGFNRNNLFAVDHSHRTVRSLRAKGTLTIGGDFVDVIRSWPTDGVPSVVFGDFCCGLEMALITDLGNATGAGHYRDTVFAFNFLRGRDQSTNEWRDSCQTNVREWEGTIKEVQEMRGAKVKELGFLRQANSQKHRGLHFALLITESVWLALKGVRADAWERYGLMVRIINERMSPRLFSYKSDCGQVFDSIVMRSPLYGISVAQAPSLEWQQGTLSRQIAAARAHRTMRLDRSGPYARA